LEIRLVVFRVDSGQYQALEIRLVERFSEQRTDENQPFYSYFYSYFEGF
jgi:hypothetical protein